MNKRALSFFLTGAFACSTVFGNTETKNTEQLTQALVKKKFDVSKIKTSDDKLNKILQDQRPILKQDNINREIGKVSVSQFEQNNGNDKTSDQEFALSNSFKHMKEQNLHMDDQHDTEDDAMLHGKEIDKLSTEELNARLTKVGFQSYINEFTDDHKKLCLKCEIIPSDILNEMLTKVPVEQQNEFLLLLLKIRVSFARYESFADEGIEYLKKYISAAFSDDEKSTMLASSYTIPLYILNSFSDEEVN